MNLIVCDFFCAILELLFTLSVLLSLGFDSNLAKRCKFSYFWPQQSQKKTPKQQNPGGAFYSDCRRINKRTTQANVTYANIPNPSYGSFLLAHQSNNVKNNTAFFCFSLPDIRVRLGKSTLDCFPSQRHRRAPPSCCLCRTRMCLSLAADPSHQRKKTLF